MDIRKLTTDGDSVRVTVPKDGLRERGLLDEDGQLVEEMFAKIEDDGEGWRITPLDV